MTNLPTPKKAHVTARISSVWPFDLFTDTIELEDEKLTITQRGFLTRKVIPVEYKDLFNIEILEAPLFCTVRVISKYVTGGQVDIPYVSKSEGIKFQALALEKKKQATSSGGQGGE